MFKEYKPSFMETDAYQKLNEDIKRNPDIDFSVVGYSDGCILVKWETTLEPKVKNSKTPSSRPKPEQAIKVEHKNK